MFTCLTVKHKLSKDAISKDGQFPVYSSETANNGIIGYTEIPEFNCDSNNPVYVNFGDHTRNFNIATESFSVLDNVKVLRPTINNISISALMFILSSWQKQIPNLGYSRHWKIAKDCYIPIPLTPSREINFAFMENFIAELEAERIAELEAYLEAAGLKDTTLTADEEDALLAVEQDKIEWGKFRLGDLFGSSTRGKRLKSDDRIQGNLPFVTAGEAQEGISDFIGNKVDIFAPNTITIDMFGSAKYRNYCYGADDHIAVVHTEETSKLAAVFITSAINKVAHNGDFHYGRNFYPKDADELKIFLPITSSHNIDYSLMEDFISALQKLVIRGVAKYSEKKMAAYGKVRDK